MLTYTLFVTGLLVIFEVAFRVWFRRRMGYSYSRSRARPYVKSHPYLPFVMVPGAISVGRGLTDYPLHKGKFQFVSLIVNSLGFLNGLQGDRTPAMPKPRGCYRINCIGASTTGNYIADDQGVHSYPLGLEQILNQSSDTRFEVNNFGQGGYNSAEVLIRVLFDCLDTDPDMVVVYMGYNDISAYLTSGLRTDYSHCRKSLDDKSMRITLAKCIPQLPLKFIDFIFAKVFLFEARSGLTRSIVKGRVDLEQDYADGLKVFERNLSYIISICKERKVRVILSTFCHYLYNDIQSDVLHQKYADIVKHENACIKKIAKKYDVVLVENDRLVPQEDEYFVDSIHFSPVGMRAIAENIAKAVRSSFHY